MLNRYRWNELGWVTCPQKTAPAGRGGWVIERIQMGAVGLDKKKRRGVVGDLNVGVHCRYLLSLCLQCSQPATLCPSPSVHVDGWSRGTKEVRSARWRHADDGLAVTCRRERLIWLTHSDKVLTNCSMRVRGGWGL